MADTVIVSVITAGGKPAIHYRRTAPLKQDLFDTHSSRHQSVTEARETALSLLEEIRKLIEEDLGD